MVSVSDCLKMMNHSDVTCDLKIHKTTTCLQHRTKENKDVFTKVQHKQNLHTFPAADESTAVVQNYLTWFNIWSW